MKAIEAEWPRGDRKGLGVPGITMEEDFMWHHAEGLATFSFLEGDGETPFWEMAGYGLQVEENGP